MDIINDPERGPEFEQWFKNRYLKNEMPSPLPFKPHAYRGFSDIPDLRSMEGRKKFYQGYDRGVTEGRYVYGAERLQLLTAAAEGSGSVRKCSGAWIDSLFEDYQHSILEAMFCGAHQARADAITDATEKEFDRLQNGPELFANWREKHDFQHRLAHEVLGGNLFGGQYSEFQFNMLLVKEVKLADEREEDYPTYKDGIKDWAQFINNEAPGMPELPEHALPLPKSHDNAVSTYVLTPTAVSIRDKWLRDVHGAMNSIDRVSKAQHEAVSDMPRAKHPLTDSYR